MSMVHRARRRLRALVSRSEVEREMEEEMRFHLEMEVQDRIRAGMTEEEAMRTALRDFGGVERFKEEARDGRGTRVMEDVLQDVKYGARVLRKTPLVTLVIVATFALAIGATTAVFSLVNGVLLNPLPYPESDRLVIMREIEKGGAPNWASHPNFVDWREQARSFEAIASAEWPEPVTVLGANEPVRAQAMGVSREFFQVARVQPFLGRAILPEENRPGGAPTVVVSHAFWEQHLGGATDLASRRLELYGEVYQVVGVMPAGFRLLGDVSVWYPYERSPGTSRNSHAYRVLGRLADGVSVEEARREMKHLSAVLYDVYGEGNTRAVDVYVNPLHDESVGGSRRTLLLLLGASGLLLLVACTNIASTLLARGMARQQELAIRASLGAGRLRIVRQLFAESVLLALAGSAVGVLLAIALVNQLVKAGAGLVPRISEVGVSAPVLVFATLVTFAAALLFGMLPSLRLAENDVGEFLRSGTRGSSVGRQGLWRTLVAAEIAMAAMLLIGAGLTVRSLARLLALDTGYRTENVLAMNIALPPGKYADSARVLGYHERLVAEMRAIPGVQAAGLTNKLPLEWGSWTANAGTEGMADGAERPTAGWRVVNADYFAALEIPVLRGRTFSPADRAGTVGVAMVTEPLAERLWPGEDALGKRVRNGFDPRGEWLTVVGVVRPPRNWSNPRPHYDVYVPLAQRPEHASTMWLLLATNGPVDAAAAAARERLRRVDADVPADLVTMEELVGRTVSGRRFTMLLLAGFAVAALVLAAVGIYGVVSYALARRTREIGIRLALGAHPRAVRRLIQRTALRTAAVGLLIGVLAALLFAGVMEALLYEVEPRDPLTYAVVVAVLLATTLVASYLPARRSTRVDPMITMRAE